MMMPLVDILNVKARMVQPHLGVQTVPFVREGDTPYIGAVIRGCLLCPCFDRGGRKNQSKVFNIYSAIAFASLSGIVFSSNFVMPVPGFLILEIISAGFLILFASRSFL